jgi:hypothetical protein
MALKPDRIETQTDVSFFVTSIPAGSTYVERGGIASVTTGGSGVAMDDANAVVTYVTAASGAKPVGVLLNDVVNLDLTRQHINWHKDEVQVGGKVTLLQVGQVTTDKVTGTINPGQTAYVGASGLFTATPPTDSLTEDANYRVGKFLSSRDSDGYVKVAVNIA